MEDCPYEWSKKSFTENHIFFLEKDSWLRPRINRENAILMGQEPIKNYGLTPLFLLFNI